MLLYMLYDCIVGCMYMMKVVNTRDPVTQVSPQYLVAMLEYLTFVGHDTWDVLIAIKPGLHSRNTRGCFEN